MGVTMSYKTKLALTNAGPDLNTLMDYLSLSKSQKSAYLSLFIKIDKDASGQISLIEFFKALKMQYNMFTEKAFLKMDVNIDEEGGGDLQLDVAELFIGVFNLCFLDRGKLVKYLFDVYDTDNDGEITTVELAQIVEDVCGKNQQHLVEKLMKLLDNDKSGAISFTEFSRVEKEAGTLLSRVYVLQNELKLKMMGLRFWRQKQRMVNEMIHRENCDSLISYFAIMLAREMPPPPSFDEDDLIDYSDSDDENAAQHRNDLDVVKTYEELEFIKRSDALIKVIDEFKEKELFTNEFEEFRKLRDIVSGLPYWVNTKTKEELWTLPAPGQVIRVGGFQRALDYTYERAYWFHLRTRERVWVLPNHNRDAHKKVSDSALAQRRERGFPNPPPMVSAAGGLSRAAVWWSNPLENEKYPNTSVIINRYRLDKSENENENDEGVWKIKGSQTLTLKDDAIDNVLPVRCHVENIMYDTTYRFTVVYVNAMGQSLESTYSNSVEIVLPLPEGWIKHDRANGKTFYANKKTNQKSWSRPAEDPYFVETSLLLKFTRKENKKLIAVYKAVDWDASKKISKDEYRDFLMEVGERKVAESDKQIRWLWDYAEVDDFGETDYANCVMMLDELRSWKMSQKTFVERYICFFCCFLYTRRRLCCCFRNAKISGKTKELLGGDNEVGVKMGDWVKFMDPLLVRPYYHNTGTGQTVWEMPAEVRFFLPRRFNDDLRRRYNNNQMESFQREFALMDLDGSGAIDEIELGMILENIGEHITKDRLKALIKEIDVDGSGEVEYGEFMMMIDAVYQGKGGFGWNKVKTKFGEKKNVEKMIEMKNNLDVYADEYDKAQVAEARKIGYRYPHGFYCYCGCRREYKKDGSPVERGGREMI